MYTGELSNAMYKGMISGLLKQSILRITEGNTKLDQTQEGYYQGIRCCGDAGLAISYGSRRTGRYPGGRKPVFRRMTVLARIDGQTLEGFNDAGSVF